MKKMLLFAFVLMLPMICWAQSEMTVHVDKAGSLKDLLGDHKESVEELIVSGVLNGDDVVILKTMCSAAGKLVVLDLADARFLEGGSSYATAEGVQIFTKQDILTSYMFQSSKLKEISLPNSIKSVENNVFENCVDLKKVILPEFVESLGENTFAGCAQLEDINIPMKTKEISGGAFTGCSGLSMLSLPEGLISLGKGAFANCNSLKKIELPFTLSNIEERAFAGCTALQEIYEYAVNIPSFGPNVFESVNKNTCKVYVPVEMVEDYSACEGFKDFANISGFNVNERTVTVSVVEAGTLENLLGGDEAMKSIGRIKVSGKLNGDDLFTLRIMCKGPGVAPSEYNLHYIDMLDADIVEGGYVFMVEGENYVTVNDIMTGTAFEYCCDLYEIILPKSLKGIGNYAFSCAENLEKIVLGDNIETLGECSFYQCKALKSFEIPELVSVAPVRSFAHCESLVNLKFSPNLKTVEKMAFGWCPKLKEVELPEGLTNVGMGSFFGCESLEKVVFPSTMTEIGSNAFVCCDLIKDIYTWAVEPILCNEDPFSMDKNSCVLHVSIGSKEKYAAALVWKDFESIVEESPDGIIQVSEKDEIIGYFDLNGVMHSVPVEGLNLVKMKSGLVKKMIF